jgi:hypothetical protein
VEKCGEVLRFGAIGDVGGEGSEAREMFVRDTGVVIAMLCAYGDCRKWGCVEDGAGKVGNSPDKCLREGGVVVGDMECVILSATEVVLGGGE